MWYDICVCFCCSASTTRQTTLPSHSMNPRPALALSPSPSPRSPHQASATGAPLPPRVAREVARELKALQQSALDGIRVTVHDDSIATVHAEIDGPGEPTRVTSGLRVINSLHRVPNQPSLLFHMKLLLGRDFPDAAPKGNACPLYPLSISFDRDLFPSRTSPRSLFRMKLQQRLCVRSLSSSFPPIATHPQPSLNLPARLLPDAHFPPQPGPCVPMQVVRCLLIEPYPESALNEDAGKLLLEDYNAYARHARLFTSIHAAPASSSALTSAGKAKQQAQQSQPQQQQQQHEPGRQEANNQSPSKNQQRACTQSATAADLLSDSGRAASSPAAASAPPATPTPCAPGAAATGTDTAVSSRDSSSTTPPAPPPSTSVVDPTTGKNLAGSASVSSAHHTPLATNRSLANADSRRQAKETGNGSAAAAAMGEPVAASSTGSGVVKAKGKGENTGRGGGEKKADLRKKSLRRL
ncbi:unnamed protein product [Closterium sp. NIES-65]|nr:unnamed protein product [Closterium sp. NIES-65]